MTGDTFEFDVFAFSWFSKSLGVLSPRVSEASGLVEKAGGKCGISWHAGNRCRASSLDEMTAACFNIEQVIPGTNHNYQDTALQKAAVTLTARLCITQPWWDVRHAAVRLFGGKDWGQSDKRGPEASETASLAPASWTCGA
jgi:hypothetical protein